MEITRLQAIMEHRPVYRVYGMNYQYNWEYVKLLYDERWIEDTINKLDTNKYIKAMVVTHYNLEDRDEMYLERELERPKVKKLKR